MVCTIGQGLTVSQEFNQSLLSWTIKKCLFQKIGLLNLNSLGKEPLSINLIKIWWINLESITYCQRILVMKNISHITYGCPSFSKEDAYKPHSKSKEEEDLCLKSRIWELFIGNSKLIGNQQHGLLSIILETGKSVIIWSRTSLLLLLSQLILTTAN